MKVDFVTDGSPGSLLITEACSWFGLIEHYPAFAEMH
jgi:hypothetical protein